MSPRTRVAVDATSISLSGKGIARVQRETVRALDRLGRYDLVAYVSGDVALGVPTRRLRRRPALLLEQIGLARSARDADAVLTWTDRLPVASRGRFIVWLFELPMHRIAENRARGAGPYQRASDLATQALWRYSLRHAAAVLAGSAATAAEVEEALPSVSRVPVVYPGLAERFAPGPGREGRYVFHLASSDPRDNTAAVIEAVARANTVLRLPVPLVIAGTTAADDTPGVEYLGRVSDEELVDLYRGAAAYVDASLFEGFGYQPLEAMACGTPVIASDTSSSREILAETALLCDPHDVAGRAAALVRLLENPGLGEELRRRGLERARSFSWERTAAELATVIDEVVG